MTRSDLMIASRRDGGFTLLEMLLVLAILVAFTAITFPAVDRMYATHRIRHAALEIRTQLAAARLHAIDEGKAYEFRFEPGGRHLVVVPSERTTRSFGSTDAASPTSNDHAAWSFHRELPEQLRFAQIRAPIERLDPRSLSSLSVASELTTLSWSPAIKFAPSGRSTTSEFELHDSEGRYVTLSVRGLTGAASSSGIRIGSDR